MRYAVAVAEERSFTRAAERCHVVQSALSHQIKALERELGTVLFARNSRRVDVTAAGEAFLASARACLDAADRVVVDVAEAQGQVRGTLTLGLIPTVTALDVPAVLGDFHRTHPEVRIAARGGASDAFISAIADGTLDVAVLGLPESFSRKGIRTRLLARERHVAVVSAGHRFADRRRLRMADLADETFVDFPEGGTGRAQTDLAFARNGLRRHVAFEVSDIDLMLGLVRNGLATALLTPGAIPDDPDQRTVAVVDGPTRHEYLAWSEFNPSPAARAFVDAVRAADAG